jgi:DNA polymerase III alpha subunit
LAGPDQPLGVLGEPAWLSEHHPVELLAGLLDEQPLGFYTRDTLIREAQRRAITVHPPEINASATRCTVDAAGEILGLAQIKGSRESEIHGLIDAREHHGVFASLEELAAHSPARRRGTRAPCLVRRVRSSRRLRAGGPGAPARCSETRC